MMNEFFVVQIYMTDASDLVIRHLETLDYYRGYLELLGQLTEVGDVTFEEFRVALCKMNVNAGHQVWVVVDKNEDKILASGTLLVEPKFIHKCGSVGHIEDIVVCDQARGLGLGQKIVQHLIEQAKRDPTCYKVSLYCKPELVKFYEKSNLKIKETQMVLYLT